MKKIHRKTQKEIEKEENQVTPISVEETIYYYWACDKCNIAFFKGDTINHIKSGGYKCTNIVSHIFGKKQCGERIYGGDEESFNKYYKLI